MDIRDLLNQVARGNISVEEAERRLKLTAVEDVFGVARLDVGRQLRHGVPEVVLAEGKQFSDLAQIVHRFLESRGNVVLSRLKPSLWGRLAKLLPSGIKYKYNDRARMAIIAKRALKTGRSGGIVGVLSAGTSDSRQAEEAREMAKLLGCKVLSAYDVGVAGLHRLKPALKQMIQNDADVLIVAAGMEGALPSVVAGLVDVPVIALPTSTGYGAGGKGLAALLSMLQTCSLGVSVVNIDAGVAAGACAALIANRAARFRKGVRHPRRAGGRRAKI